MKNLSKLTALALALVMTLALAACGGGTAPGAAATPAGGESQPPASQAPSGDGAAYTVGICQLVTHDALDAATQGFMDALKEELGDAVTFDLQNAANDSNTCSTIVNAFVADGVDLILANATAPLQAAAQATADIPILGTSVTDYATALDISDWTGTVGGNISGTSDLAPLDQQAAMIQELFPDAKTVGLLYCSAEPNSVYQCDVYIPTDNTAASNTEAIANVVLPAKVPVVAGEEGICNGCGVATLSISYYDLGHATGEMAAKILAEGGDISTMPVEYAPNVAKKYNAANCEALGITPPDGYEAIG